MFTLLTLGVLLVIGLVCFAAVLVVVKLVLLLVFLPLRLAFRLVLLPVRLVFAVLMVPVFLIVAAACGVGLLAALFAVSLPLLPLLILGGAVWLMVRRGGRAARPV